MIKTMYCIRPDNIIQLDDFNLKKMYVDKLRYITIEDYDVEDYSVKHNIKYLSAIHCSEDDEYYKWESLIANKCVLGEIYESNELGYCSFNKELLEDFIETGEYIKDQTLGMRVIKEVK